MPTCTRWRFTAATVLAAAVAWPAIGFAQVSADADKPALNSAIDETLFHQLLLGELELRVGSAETAFAIILDAARRTRDEQLFRRALDIALQGRSAERAFAVTRAWRQALPQSLDALRTQLQMLSAFDRLSEVGEPMRTLLSLTPEAERSALIAVLPRFLQRMTDRKQAAQMLDGLLDAYTSRPGTRAAALVASGRVWAAAEDFDRALERARAAAAADPEAPGPALLALDLMPRRTAAEDIVRQRLQRQNVDAAIRLAYVRALTNAQRYVDAVTQLETVTRERPELAPPFLTLGALQLELRQPVPAEAALTRYVQLQSAAGDASGSGASAPEGTDDDDSDAKPEQGLVQAWLLLAQAAEQRKDFGAAETWLGRIDDPKRALEVQTRRATLMARQGRLAEARETVRRAPERAPGDARAKLVAEAGVLREVKHWGEAFEVLDAAAQRFPDDPDLLYEQAMVAEKMERLDDMERLLRRVIEIKPDNAHAHNALGYSLADRRVRLPEARELIRRALELSPGDPFITDSLGWVEFRLGNLDEAVRWLRQAYASRPDVEIGAHLGEVLWSKGDRDEARRIWGESKGRDAANDVLRETLARLKVDL